MTSLWLALIPFQRDTLYFFARYGGSDRYSFE
jgi:hypothetical protein